MKKITYLLSFLFIGTLSAQNADKMTTTQVKTVQEIEDGKVIDKKVKVITTKEQAIKIDPKDKGKVNGDRVYPPMSVTKTILVDNDNDPFYDEKTILKYYQYDGKRYAFRPSGKGFVMNFFDKKNNETIEAKATKSSKNAYYFVNSDNLMGFGYFDDNNKFVIEYFDKNTNTTNFKEFLAE